MAVSAEVTAVEPPTARDDDRVDQPTPPAGPSWPLEVGALLVLAAIAALCARPLLEEWGFVELFNGQGVSAYWDLVQNFPLRPLQGVPYILQWRLGAGSSAGFALGFYAMLVLRYVAAWWAVSGFVSPWPRATIAVAAAILPTWTAEWYLRYSPAHLSSIFYFVLLGSVLRAARRLSWVSASAGAVAMALMLATYEALAVCAVSLPIAVGLFASPASDRLDLSSLRTWARVTRAAVPVAAGSALYGVYAVVATKEMGSGYEGTVVQHSRLGSVSGIASAIGDLYNTAYGASTLVPVFFALVIAVIVGPSLASMPTRFARVATAVGFAAGVAVLPLAALPYVVNPGFSADPDRVLFPVAVAFVTVAAIAAIRSGVGVPAHSGRLSAVFLVAAVLLTTLTPAVTAYRYHQVQKDVIFNVVRIAEQRGVTSVVLADYSGRLGDVYTLYPPTLQIVLNAEGVSLLATICTPQDVDRVDPVARRLLIPTTPRCDSPGAISPGQLVINVTPVGENLSFAAAP